MNALAHKVALVTGATSGIGRATAIALAKASAKIVAGGRRVAEGESLVADIKAGGGDAIFVRTDVTREDDLRLLVEKAMAAYGRLDVAFNNAGVLIAGALPEATAENYQQVFDTNVRSVLLSMKHEIPAMLRGGGGSIINTSSIAGHVGMANLAIYVASKHAVEGLTKAAALEYAQQGIRVNAVALLPSTRPWWITSSGRKANSANTQIAAPHRTHGEARRSRQRRAFARQRRGELCHRP